MSARRLRGSLAALVVLGATALGTGPAAMAEDGPCTTANQSSRQSCLERFELGSGATLPYYGSYPLSGSTAPTGAVVIIHGTGRNAEHYFGIGEAAAEDLGPKAEIIAPWFQTEEDGPEDGDAYWTNGEDTSWKDGGDAVEPSGLSSFGAVDEILTALADKSHFPNLTKVTLVGHSAGGQFVQRYAAGGRGPAAVKGLAIHYVVANPSSYLYLDSKRPADVSDCPDFNDYKYGLEHRNDYMSKLTDEQIVDQYTKRDVTYLLGEKDTQRDDELDTTCAADAQGQNRLERGKAYYSAIHATYPDAPHQMSTVPGIAHENEAMLTSKEGKAAILRGW